MDGNVGSSWCEGMIQWSTFELAWPTEGSSRVYVSALPSKRKTRELDARTSEPEVSVTRTRLNVMRASGPTRTQEMRLRILHVVRLL